MEFDLIATISDYYVTGVFMVIETTLIIILVAFLAWNVKLFMEEPKEGEEMVAPPEEE